MQRTRRQDLRDDQSGDYRLLFRCAALANVSVAGSGPVLSEGWQLHRFVSNVQSRALLRRAIALFRKNAKIPSEAASLPAFIPGVSWSDQWSFWQHGYPAIMVTDTAPFRYPYYHSASDTPDKLDYDRFTLVVRGMEKVIQELAK